MTPRHTCYILSLITSIWGHAHHHQLLRISILMMMCALSAHYLTCSIWEHTFLVHWPLARKPFIIMRSNHLSSFSSSLDFAHNSFMSFLKTLPASSSHFISSPLLFCSSILDTPHLCPPPLHSLPSSSCVSAPLLRGSRTGRGNLRPQLDSAMQDVSDLYLLMEETEKQAVRRALLEERGRYCTFINMLQPVVVRDTFGLCHAFKIKAVRSLCWWGQNQIYSILSFPLECRDCHAGRGDTFTGHCRWPHCPDRRPTQAAAS